jgi:hypothetical protein
VIIELMLVSSLLSTPRPEKVAPSAAQALVCLTMHSKRIVANGSGVIDVEDAVRFVENSCSKQVAALNKSLSVYPPDTRRELLKRFHEALRSLVFSNLKRTKTEDDILP